MYDLLIKHVRIIDGTSAPWFRGWVAVKDGRIVRVGTSDAERTGAPLAKETVDDAIAALASFGPEADFLRDLVQMLIERKK